MTLFAEPSLKHGQKWQNSSDTTTDTTMDTTTTNCDLMTTNCDLMTTNCDLTGASLVPHWWLCVGFGLPLCRIRVTSVSDSGNLWKSWNFVIFRKTTENHGISSFSGKHLKTKGTGHPDPYHGVPPRYAPCTPPPITRVPLPRAPTTVLLVIAVPRAQTARHRSPGFFGIQHRTLNTDLCKTATFNGSKTDLSKLTFLLKMPT